ncbi:hypothetical protein M422DRAFT_263488 [Sphaerobolus stellatus SS14]|uniref:Uncharacterized protein n=1 Tax=Sphaerobolus stellatus (strain SS14) TaxID=990650 RepID=A0A0C9VA68_SPHS4|nr:hypothetical protein M422DRAFT_263488 [Sphaerobolus stellatus SS14]
MSSPISCGHMCVADSGSKGTSFASKKGSQTLKACAERLVFEEAERRIEELENNQLKAESFSTDETPPLLQNTAQLNSLVHPVLQILGEYLFQYDRSLNTPDPAHSPRPIYSTFTLNHSLCEWTALRIWQDILYISDDESIPGPASSAIIRLAL